MILRRYNDHYILLDNGRMIGTTDWGKYTKHKTKPIYRHQCDNAFMGVFHQFEIEVDCDGTVDDRGYINMISRRDGDR